MLHPKSLLLALALLAAPSAAADAVGASDLHLLLSPDEYLRTSSPSAVLSSTFPTPALHSLFESWKGDHARTYATVGENAMRKLVWLRNHATIESHNRKHAEGSKGHTLGHNDFSDVTQEEFREKFYLGEFSPGVFAPRGMDDGSSSWWGSSFGSSPSRVLLGEEGDAVDIGATDEEDATRVVDDVPDAKDWNEEGAVTKVKNQWFCGACWAFSAVGAIEGARYIKTGNLTELSIQQLLDCDMTDLGCGGGLMAQAFDYDGTDAVGLCSLEEYPYAYHRHWFYGCKRFMPKCTPLPHTKVAQYVNVTATEADLKAAVATQPVSVAVAAGAVDWQFYAGGVMHQGCDDDIDHGVLAVGYGHDPSATDPAAGTDGADYWLVKNSWGEGWGMDGFVRLGRGTGNEEAGGSACILTMASRPIMKAED